MKEGLGGRGKIWEDGEGNEGGGWDREWRKGRS